MKITYSSDVDVLYIKLRDGEIDESDEVDGIIFDYSADGSVVGIEILDASKRVELERLVVESLPVSQSGSRL